MLIHSNILETLKIALHFKRYSLFFRFYILILVIVIVLIVTFSVYISNLLSQDAMEQTEQIHEQVLAQTAREIDRALHFLEQILAVTANSQDIVDAAIRPGLMYTDRNQAVAAYLRDIPESNIFIDAIWLYEETTEMVFASDGTVSSLDRYSGAQLLDAVCGRADRGEDAVVIAETGRSRTVVTFCEGNVYLVYNSLRATDGKFMSYLIGEIAAQTLFQSATAGAEELGCGLEITSAAGTRLYSNMDTVEGRLGADKIHMDSGDTQLGYDLYPQQYEGSNWLDIMGRAIPFIVAATLFSLVLALFLAEKMYSPISKLTRNVQKGSQESLQDDTQHSEIAFLNQTYSSILQNKKLAENLLREVYPELEKRLFLELLGGEVDPAVLERRLSDIGSGFSVHGWCHVMALYFAHLSEAEDMLSYLSIYEMEQNLESLFPVKYGRIRYLQRNHIGVVVLQYPREMDQAVVSNLEAAFTKRVQTLLRSQGIQVLLAWGNPHETLLELQSAYKEAYNRLKKQIYLQSDGGSGSEEVPVQEGLTEEYFVRKIDNLRTSFTSSGIDTAKNELEQLLRELRDDDVGLQQQKMAYGILLDTLIEKLMQFQPGQSFYSTRDYQEMYTTIETCGDRKRLSEQVEGNVFKIFGFIQVQLMRRQNRIVERAKEYISENYENGDLSAQMIADSIGITPAYLSNLFTRQMDESLNTYINKYRVNIAISLLKNTSISIKEIGFRTGFNTAQNFNRVFKRVTGETPGQYREKEGG